MRDALNRVHFGDCRDNLRAMAAAGVKVQTCVTSPPYFGLRSYGGGEAEIGKEETPQQFIDVLVEVFRCVRDVLSDDGVIWVNIGDSYAANRSYQVPSTKGGKKHSETQAAGGRGSKVPSVLKPKDLIGIPWRLAFALQADGWWLRQEIIWHSPNSMPERVTDRLVGAHEHIFLLSKKQNYYFDFESIQEDGVGGEKRRKRDVWSINSAGYKGAHGAVFPPALVEPCILAGSRPGDVVLDPFMGSGTTAAVAIAHDRQFVGCELNTDYKPLQDERIAEAHARRAEVQAAADIVARQPDLFATTED